MPKIVILTVSQGPEEANRLLKSISQVPYRGLGNVSTHAYVDCKFNGEGISKVFNLETFSAALVDLRNTALSGTKDQSLRQAYFTGALQAMALTHLSAIEQPNYLALLSEPVQAKDIANVINSFDGRGRAVETFVHHSTPYPSYIFDCRRIDTLLSFATGLRLYQTGAVHGFPSYALDYILSCAYAASENLEPEQKKALMVTTRQCSGIM